MTESIRMTVEVLPDISGQRWIGYYGHKRRKAGDQFELEAPEHFSKRWMKPIGWMPVGYDPKKAPTSAQTKADVPRTPLLKNPSAAQAPLLPRTPAALRSAPAAEPVPATATAPISEPSTTTAPVVEESPI